MLGAFARGRPRFGRPSGAMAGPTTDNQEPYCSNGSKRGEVEVNWRFAAVDQIMGHIDPSTAAHYPERISDERLEAVASKVRHWLFSSELTPD